MVSHNNPFLTHTYIYIYDVSVLLRHEVPEILNLLYDERVWNIRLNTCLKIEMSDKKIAGFFRSLLIAFLVPG